MIGGMIDWRPEIRRRSKVTNMHVTARIALVGLLLLPSAAFAQRAGPAAGARRDDYVKAAQARAEGLAGKRFDQIDGGHKGVISRDAYIKYYEARSARRAGSSGWTPTTTACSKNPRSRRGGRPTSGRVAPAHQQTDPPQGTSGSAGRDRRKEAEMADAATIETSGETAAAAVRIAAIDHVVLRVADLDRAIVFYGKVLGCHIERTLEKPKLVQLRAGGSLIDLVPAGAQPAAAGVGNMDHFALRLEAFDAAALAAHLRRQGVNVGEVHERYGAEGYGPSIYITDPDGNTVELKGPATRGL
jgi:glyoxylase I family protein